MNVKGFIKEVKRVGLPAYMCIAGASIVLTVILMSLLAPLIAPYDPIKSVARPLLPPSEEHPMGTDLHGRDVYSRIIYGGRVVLLVSALSVLMSLAVGVPLGLLSGYVGGLLDRVIALFMDSLYSFPGIILAIAIAAMLGSGNLLNIAVAIAVVYIPMYFRMVRGQVLSLKESLFVEAARAIGAKARTIMFTYILPHLLPAIVVILSLNVADAILTEAGLSFLGLGVNPPTPDWGFDLRDGKRYLPAGYWWLITFPGLMIIITVIGITLLGEGLNDWLNPKLREM